jgi:hypothetical protein
VKLTQIRKLHDEAVFLLPCEKNGLANSGVMQRDVAPPYRLLEHE